MAKIKKIRQKKFTVIDNAVIEDIELSWKAKGLFIYLWSKPDDWQFYEVEVAKHSKDGRDSLRSALKELEGKGYLKRSRKRSDKGVLGNSEWILSEKPMLEKPMSEKPMSENPTQEKQTLLNTDNTKDLNNKILNKLSTEDIVSDGSDIASQVSEIIDYLNSKTEKHYKPSSAKTKKLVKARLSEGFTVDDFKKVIDNKTNSWLKDKKMNQYLRPETLFGTKFEGYLNEKTVTRTGFVRKGDINGIVF